MDEKDHKILNLLRENSKLSTQQISKKTLIPITTVHHRIKKMEKEGIISKYTVEVDNKRLGFGLSAYILIAVDYKLLRQTQKDIARRLKQLESVTAASNIAGEHDIIIKVNVKDMHDLDHFITEYLRRIDGVARTRTLMVLSDI